MYDDEPAGLLWWTHLGWLNMKPEASARKPKAAYSPCIHHSKKTAIIATSEEGERKQRKGGSIRGNGNE